MSKSEYSHVFNIDRMKIDKMIKEGNLSVEEISGKHYIIIKSKSS